MPVSEHSPLADDPDRAPDQGVRQETAGQSDDTLSPATPGPAGQGPWVTLAEATEATGVSTSALRKWYRAGVVPSRVEAGRYGPQRLVPLNAVLDRLAHREPTRAAGANNPRPETPLPDPQGPGTDTGLREVAAALRELSDRVARIETRLDSLARPVSPGGPVRGPVVDLSPDAAALRDALRTALQSLGSGKLPAGR